MSVKLMYEIITQENFVYRMEPEVYEDKDIEKARARYKELKNTPFVANLRHEVTAPARRVVTVVYPNTKCEYTFETDFAVRSGQYVTVDDLDHPGWPMCVRAITADHYETEADLSARFDLKRLRKLTGKVA